MFELAKMGTSLQKKDQVCKIWRPPFCGGPRPMAPMAPIEEKALMTRLSVGNSPQTHPA